MRILNSVTLQGAQIIGVTQPGSQALEDGPITPRALGADLTLEVFGEDLEGSTNCRASEAPVSMAVAGAAVTAGPLLGDEVDALCLRPGRLRGRTISPRTSWQNTATAVLLMGRQCCVSSSAIAR